MKLFEKRLKFAKKGEEATYFAKYEYYLFGALVLSTVSVDGQGVEIKLFA